MYIPLKQHIRSLKIYLCKKLAISGMWNISSVTKDDYISMCVCVYVHKLLTVMLNLTYNKGKEIRT
jgi:hypothetical protein